MHSSQAEDDSPLTHPPSFKNFEGWLPERAHARADGLVASKFFDHTTHRLLQGGLRSSPIPRPCLSASLD